MQKITTKFRDDHQKLLTLVGEINTLTTGGPENIKSNAQKIGHTLARLSGILKMHLASEDQFLYPKLAGHSDPKLSGMAKAFQEEMGSITDVYKAFSTKWNMGTIEASPVEFNNECKEVFKVIGMRINREENELYKAYEGLPQ